MMDITDQKDLAYQIQEAYNNLEVNRQYPEFLMRAKDIANHLEDGESLVVRRETDESPGMFGVSKDIQKIVLYRKNVDGREERALYLDVTGLLVDDELYDSMMDITDQKDLAYQIQEAYNNLEVNRQYPEFLRSAEDIANHLEEGESLVVRRETDESPSRLGVSKNIQKIVLYRKNVDGTKERALQLDVTGLLVDDELYKSSD